MLRPCRSSTGDHRARVAAFQQNQLAFVSAINTNIEPAPQPAGTLQWVKVPSLEPGKRYYFAIKSLDAVNNLSEISNVANVVAGLCLQGDVNGDGHVEMVDPVGLGEQLGGQVG